ncbi:universal stress protein [Nocardia sp. CS682]|uniref:universal stress protein n=1 Tax=Nocardia sp. CS682 TaxID=1047172 RepID=UPI001074FFD7|nr:universal stress protein [Nocardia sp. CS682]QBS45334.1 universal stress protein [Nocardia sp. CS682]
MDTYQNDNPHQLASAAVVVGVDGSEGSDLAVRWAAETAARRERPLRIVHGLDITATRSLLGSYDVMVPSVIDAIRTRGMKVVADARRLAHEVAPSLDIATEISETSAARVLIHHSKTANLVALGATGTAGTIAHLGSTLLAVASHGHGNVVVVRTAGTEQPLRHDGPVVVGIDGSPVSETAIAAAFAEASNRKTDLIAVHSWSDWHFGEFAGHLNVGLVGPDQETAEDAILAERLAGWSEKYPDVTVTPEVCAPSPRDQLMSRSKSAQLIVVGSRGRGGFTGLLLGSTSNFLVQHAHCPVMVTHPA